MAKIALGIHGGAGTILRSQMTPALEMEYRTGLQNGLKAGWEILSQGGRSLDAVDAAVSTLEDFPLFNAGRGSVFTHEGKVEMDAAIMNGRDLSAGAVTFVTNIKNPIKLARLVMETTGHVLLAGEGANQFAIEMGVKTEPDEYFFTEHRWRQLIESRNADRVELDHSLRGDIERGGVTGPLGDGELALQNGDVPVSKPIGTVGAVACDSNGDLAAATSTGGMTNKKFGRVGDSALIGAGTYADTTCAVSCTGHGEFFMRGVTAFDVAARMKYRGLSLADAARESIDALNTLGGEGGLIAVDTSGNIVMPFNSEGMYRGFISADGEVSLQIYGD